MRATFSHLVKKHYPVSSDESGCGSHQRNLVHDRPRRTSIGRHTLGFSYTRRVTLCGAGADMYYSALRPGRKRTRTVSTKLSTVHTWRGLKSFRNEVYITEQPQ
jgi:hypothetical protein